MQVEVDLKRMQTNFDGRGLSGFGDIATFKNGQIFLLTHGLYIVHGHQKFNCLESDQKIHVSRG